MRHFKIRNSGAGKRTDKGRPAVRTAEADVGGPAQHQSLRIFRHDFQFACRSDETDGVGRRERHPEIARFVKGDAVGKTDPPQHRRSVNLGRSDRPVFADSVAQNPALHGFCDINELFRRVERDAVGKADAGRRDLRRPVLRNDHQRPVGDRRTQGGVHVRIVRGIRHPEPSGKIEKREVGSEHALALGVGHHDRMRARRGDPLHLAVAEIGDDRVAFLVQADAVGQAAQVTEEGRTAVRTDARAPAVSVGGNDAAVILGHDAFGAGQSCAQNFDIHGIDAHGYILSKMVASP